MPPGRRSADRPGGLDPTTDPSRTAELLASLRRGDRGARQELVRRYEEPLQRFLRGRVPRARRGVLETQDLAQEVWTRVLPKLEGFEPHGVGSLWAYIRRTALNAVRSAHRASANTPAGSLDDSHPPQVADPAASRGTELVHEEELRAFERAVDTLPERKREALWLRFDLDLSYEDIARECGYTTSDAARMAITRSLAQVLDVVKRDGLA